MALMTSRLVWLYAFIGLLVSYGQTRYRDYALVLEDPPLAERVDSRKTLHSAAAQDQRERLVAAQSALEIQLGARKIPVTWADQTLVNAVFVQATANQESELRALPGVKHVQYLAPLKRHLDRALDLVRVSGAWNVVGGSDNAGANVKIGVLDTGIDNMHPAFRDDSFPAPPAGYPKGDTAYTNRKIIVARSYVAQLPFADVRPEDSRPDDITPRDRSGHGTAMAMIVAGGLNSGPLASIRGVAPRAYLGNYKIFGSTGVNDTTRAPVVIQALNAAINDGMDIVVLALGSPAVYGPLDRGCGSSDICDTRADAVENAVRMGLTVVVSAGDDGNFALNSPALGSINTPGTAPSAITVGATTNAHFIYASLRVTGDDVPVDLTDGPALFGQGPKLSGPLTAPLRDVAQSGNDGRACTPLPGGWLAGAIALIQRGNCDFFTKINNAQKAGAVAVVIYEAQGNSPFAPGGRNTGIPAVGISNTRGVSLKNFLQSHRDRAVTLDPALRATDDIYDTVADFSSRGPSIGNLSIKPELAAVGTDLYTVTQRLDTGGDLYHASGYNTVNGTSFAAALVAGTAALVKQKNPGFTPAQIKSAVVNTAVNGPPGETILDGTNAARVTAVGAGKLNAAAAVATFATVVPSTISFGAIGQTLPPPQTLRVTNSSGGNITFSVTVVPRGTDANARVTVSGTSLSLNAGQSNNISVQLQGSRPLPGSYDGVVLIEGGGTRLRVPYLYLAGENTAANMLSIGDDDFIVTVNDPDVRPAFKLVDKFGVPLVNTAVRFRITKGGGTIVQGDAATDSLGIAAVQVRMGSDVGEQIITAEAGGLAIDFFGRTRARPAINPNGVVNAASFQAGSGLAPGSYAAIFGPSLSEAFLVFSGSSLALSLAGSSVSFDNPPGTPAKSIPGRLHFVSETQINLQIPWEFQGYNSVLMKVSLGESSSAVYTLPLAQTSPAAFERLGFAAAVRPNGTIVDNTNPAGRGEYVSLYVNGLGPVDNTPASGELSPGAEPLARTLTMPSVTFGGRPGQVLFSGLAPGAVGLYQINVVVPADAPTGVQPVVISIGGVDSKPSRLPVQ